MWPIHIFTWTWILISPKNKRDIEKRVTEMFREVNAKTL